MIAKDLFVQESDKICHEVDLATNKTNNRNSSGKKDESSDVMFLPEIVSGMKIIP